MAGVRVGEAKPAQVPLPERNPSRPATTLESEDVAPTGAVARLPELLNYKISKSDKTSLRSAVNAIYKGRFSDARDHIRKIKDKTAQKLAQWYYFRRRGNDGRPEDIRAFRLNNPDWPNQKRLQLNAEENLLLQKTEPAKIVAFFGDSRPATGPGKAALGGAFIAMGEEKKGKRLVSEAWQKHDLGKKSEAIVLERFGKLLTSKDHKSRVDRLLLLDRKSKLSAAKRAAEPLDEMEKKKIDARMAVVRRQKKAKKLMADIPEEHTKNDVGFYFSRIQWLRRHEKEEEAWKLLMAAPKEPDALIAINEWWIERRVNCRQALNAGHPEIAYTIAANHEPLTGKHYDEAQFLAGWIALRFLNLPEKAREHFQALRTAARGPKQIAKAEYWLGRTAVTLKDDTAAIQHYQASGQHHLTYYGQLAIQTLVPGPKRLPLQALPVPGDDDLEKFRSRDAVQTIGLIKSVDLGRLAPLFFHQLARTVDTPGEAVLLARLAEIMKQPHAFVRLSKIAFNRGLPVAELAYPTNMFPEYKEINVPVEPALIYALSRQESEFNPIAKSPVGARGLMQIMPRTARAIARQHKVRYKRSALTKDPSYNAMLGVAHLGDLLESYNGSYILTLVAYNAGGGRVRDWTKEFGDPREKQVDPIDWVERIPFTETRNYVKKILTSVQVFRSRFDGPDNSLQLVEDLNRGYTPPPKEASLPAADN